MCTIFKCNIVENLKNFFFLKFCFIYYYIQSQQAEKYTNVHLHFQRDCHNIYNFYIGKVER
jgi:hypothetical protein